MQISNKYHHSWYYSVALCKLIPTMLLILDYSYYVLSFTMI